VRRDPRRDRRRPGTSAEAVAPAPDVVVDLVLHDEGLELGQGRRGVGAVESADRHDRVAAGRELDRGSLLRALRRRDPLVLRRAGLQQLNQRAVHLGVARQPATAPAKATLAKATPAKATPAKATRTGAATRESSGEPGTASPTGKAAKSAGATARRSRSATGAWESAEPAVSRVGSAQQAPTKRSRHLWPRRGNGSRMGRGNGLNGVRERARQPGDER
jgi:hypothetical protein